MRDKARCGLIILDGAGLAPEGPANTVSRKTMPQFFDLMDRHPMTRLQACGPAVGLFPGQTGNSEVGHVTIGSGRINQSAIRKIDGAFHDGAWAKSAVWQTVDRDLPFHIVGMASDAGVHAHVNTIVQAARTARDTGLRNINVHIILDGVDSAGGSAPAILQALLAELSATVPEARPGLIMGRKWFTDRSGDLALTDHFIAAVTGALDAQPYSEAALQAHLATAGEHEFPPHFFNGGQPIRAGDTILMTSHRADRAEQATRRLAAVGQCLTLVTIAPEIAAEHIFFPTGALQDGVAQYLAKAGIYPVRIAEQCKFPHVSYFFNGFGDTLGETHICIPGTEGGPEADPRMRIAESVEACLDVINGSSERAFVVNLPNLDQVGHTGSIELCEQAARAVDAGLARIVAAARAANWSLLITADHGNAEVMTDDLGRPFGSHTCNEVPFVVVSNDLGPDVRLKSGMGLENIAATFVQMLGLPTAQSRLSESVFERVFEETRI
jgi:2,3-bisphosphoglycerate-independent phosphoglycerate mutase